MARRLAGVTVLEGGKVKWATIAGIFLGVPAYAVTHGIARTVKLVSAALDWLVLGPFSFVATTLDVAFLDAKFGIWEASNSFLLASDTAGLLAPLFAAVGTALVAYVLYRGVTAIA